MSLKFLTLDESRDVSLPWPDVYFTPGYGAAEEAASGFVWEVAVWEPGPILYPFLRRPIDHPDLPHLFDVVSPYGYAGTWAPDELPLEQMVAFRRELRRALVERGCVAELQRLSSLVAGRARLTKADPDIELVAHSDTIAVDLSQGIEAYWAGSQKRSRTAVRKARKLGYVFATRSATPQDVASDSAFRGLYEGTMRAVGASPRYFFCNAYYARLCELPNGVLQIGEVRSAVGEVVSAALFFRWQALMHYHLAGSSREAARDGVNNLLLDSMIRHACEHGASLFHLGGGVTKDDSLFRFKVGFGGIQLPFYTGRTVFDATHYDALVEAQAKRSGRPRRELEESGFFPAYRA